MTERICRRLADLLSQALDPAERDAVRGDLAELQAPRGKAVREMAGLVVRRQAVLLKDWRLWLTVLGLIGPAGVLLNRMARGLIGTIDRQLRTYLTYDVPYRNGLTMPEEAIVFLCQLFVLVLSSWIAGMAAGALLRRAVWTAGALFVLVWIVLAIVSPMPNVWLPGGIVFILPVIWGMRQGVRFGAPAFGAAISIAAVMAAMIAVATWTSGWRQAGLEAWSEGALPGGANWQTRLLPFAVMSWPAWCMLAIASLRKSGVLSR
jgi:hypothetical protein